MAPRLSRRGFFVGAAALTAAAALPGGGAASLSPSAIHALLDAEGAGRSSTPTWTASRSTRSL
jgi:hypothetical protein